MTDHEVLSLADQILEQIHAGSYDGHLRRLKDTLAEEFGRRHGWKLRKSYSPSMLQRRTQRGGLYERFEGWPSVADHPYFYRELERPYKPVAVAAHLYTDYPWDWRAAAEEFSNRFELTWETVDGFPSWYFPGRTTLILYKPASGMTVAQELAFLDSHERYEYLGQ